MFISYKGQKKARLALFTAISTGLLCPLTAQAQSSADPLIDEMIVTGRAVASTEKDSLQAVDIL